MVSKQEIFDNISTYTVDQIVGFIKQGFVSVLELEDPENTGGEYSNDMRDKVNEQLDKNEPEDWKKALDTNTVEAYQYYLDTYPDGLHRAEARERKKELQPGPEIKTPPVIEKPKPPIIEGEDTPPSPPSRWDDEEILRNKISELEKFILKHPNSPYLIDCKVLKNKITNILGGDIWDPDMPALIKRISNIQADKKVLNPDETIYNLIVSNLRKKNNNITIDELVQAMSQDKNLLGARVVHKLYDEGYLVPADFINMGVNKDFVQHMLEDIQPQKFAQPGPLSQISRPSTEIYFWGIPSSGKSCALGGILSVASNGSVASHMDKDNHCQGYGYMSRLMLQFRNDGIVGTLPEGTSTTATYEMGFDLTDNNGLIHPITCIDLAGEMIRCMYKFDSNEDLPDDELRTLDTLTQILVDNRTKNRKMHFFVIEYGADDRYYEGLPQKTYLEAAVSYIRNFEIFKRDTDAIFILVSKVDKAPTTADRNIVVREYLQKNYQGFINGLKAICRQNEINGGELEIVPFSLGTVCFQNYCLFDDSAAKMVVKKIIERTPGYKQDKFNKLFGKFKG